ncbi:TetR family transcriptional regulator [Acidovorax carolinensis]|uniref:TetR family transcriptional regulator n=1 Tax=Acidovorax carolinensis TaxID=553814 RepID=UPI0012FFBA70
MARRTKADAQTTRNNLLDAAEQLFQSRGVSHTSLNDIAVAAGTTRGAIYWHFKDKADLFNAMMERVTLPLERTLVVAYVEHATDPVAEIRRAMMEALRLIATDAQTRRVLQIATHQVEYTADMGAVLERHLSVHDGCVARNHVALERAFAARRQPRRWHWTARRGVCRCWSKGWCTNGCSTRRPLTCWPTAVRRSPCIWPDWACRTARPPEHRRVIRWRPRPDTSAQSAPAPRRSSAWRCSWA